jgi:hypothetical protein
MIGARHSDDASQRPGAMSTSHLAPVAVSAIVGGKTAFSLGSLGDGKQSSSQESGSIHGKNLAAAPATNSPDGAKQSRQKLVRSNTESFVSRYVRVWSKAEMLAKSRCFLLCLQQRTSLNTAAMSEKCRQNPTSGRGRRTAAQPDGKRDQQQACQRKPDNRISHVIVGQMHLKRLGFRDAARKHGEPPDRCRTTQPDPTPSACATAR